jgi:radical SAM superfamily enzyme YgiQ (UPF0313 family)
MNYLLVMPSGLSRSQDGFFHVFSVGIAYVSSALKKAGFNIFTLNLEFCDGDVNTIMEEMIKQNKIDVFCTGGLSRDCNEIRQMIDSVRHIKPDIVVIVGGGLISADPVPAMKVLDADIGCIGEGEITMCELAQAMDNGLTYYDIPGIIYKNKEADYIITVPREQIHQIDDIPMPDYDGFEYKKFVQATGSAIVSFNRSCIYACTFCFRPLGSRYRQRSLNSIIKEIDFQIARYELKHLAIIDSIFAKDKQFILDFCELIKKRNIIWSCSLHVSLSDLDMLNVMKDSGCIGINYGLESADDSILKSMKKGSSRKMIEVALNNIWEAKIHLTANFIFGDINETVETYENTLSFFDEQKSRFLFALDPIVAFPGSHVYKYACENGYIKDKQKYLTDNCPVINVSKLTDDEYKVMLGEITERRLSQRVPSCSFNILKSSNSGHCEIEYSCRRCGTAGKLDIHYYYSWNVVCNECGTVSYISPFEKGININKMFSTVSILDNDDLVALWGAGGMFCKLMKEFSCLSNNRYILVDSNQAQHGLKLFGKQVQPSGAINDNNIQSLIITALSRKNEIYENICTNFPTVKNIFVPDFDVTEKGIVPVLRKM